MKSYCFQMGETQCEIQVEARPTVNGPAVYIAAAFVCLDDGEILRPLTKAGVQVELPGGSEEDAVTRMGSFLETKFGTGVWPIPLCPPSADIQQIGASWPVD